MIDIDGELLDLYDQEVSMHFQSPRFADAICDDYTTDITIPLTPKNRRVLSAFCVMDNPNATYGNRVECSIHMDNTGIPLEGYLYVTEIRANEMVATLYLNNIPSGLYDLKINRAVPDDSDTIIAFNAAVATSDLGVAKYPYINGGESLAQQIVSPTIRVNTIINKISASLGVYLPTTSYLRRFLSPRLVVCPQNTTQVIQGFVRSNTTNVQFVSGQHITNDGHADWLPDGDDNWRRDYQVVFNRACHVDIQLEGYVNVQCSHIDSNNNIVDSVTIPGGSTMSTATGSWHMSEGDSIRMLKLGNVTQLSAVLAIMEISNYQITADDYDIPLAVDSFAFNYPYIIDGNGTRQYDTDVAFLYIGTICSLPDVSLRDIINGLCWLDNLRTTYSNGILNFVSSDSGEDIDMDVVSMSPQTDKLGRNNIVKWAGDARKGLSFRITSNSFLPEEVVLHTSPFYGTDTDTATGEAVIPQYESEDGALTFNEELPGLVMVDLDTANWQLVPVMQLSSLGLTEVSRILFVTATTYSDISKSGYVLHDGHKFLIVEGDTDIATNKTQFTSILV